MHSKIQKYFVISAREIQKHLSNSSRKVVVIDQGKYIKWARELKGTEKDYFLQYNDGLMNKGVKTFCDITQFLSLPFCGTCEKPYGVRDLRKHYHMRLDTKLGCITCSIRQIPYACYVYTYMLDNH